MSWVDLEADGLVPARDHREGQPGRECTSTSPGNPLRKWPRMRSSALELRIVIARSAGAGNDRLVSESLTFDMRGVTQLAGASPVDGRVRHLACQRGGFCDPLMDSVSGLDI